MFKVYDLLADGRARWTAHTAFDDPTSPPVRAAAREHRDPHAGVLLSAFLLRRLDVVFAHDLTPTLDLAPQQRLRGPANAGPSDMA